MTQFDSVGAELLDMTLDPSSPVGLATAWVEEVCYPTLAYLCRKTYLPVALGVARWLRKDGDWFVMTDGCAPLDLLIQNKADKTWESLPDKTILYKVS